MHSDAVGPCWASRSARARFAREGCKERAGKDLSSERLHISARAAADKRIGAHQHNPSVALMFGGDDVPNVRKNSSTKLTMKAKAAGQLPFAI